VSTASTRPATYGDVPLLVELYRELVVEMTALKRIWAWADGLPEPIADAFGAHLAGSRSVVYVGEYGGVPMGFLVGTDDDLLPQAGGARVGVIRLIYTHPRAREVGVGEAMAGRFLADARERGIQLFDAVVSPGHRLAKNFFESHGFKARRIVMHRDDRPEQTDVD
jgi:ribosomal protein S18 acetylase RimI-like enzyme